MQQQPHDGAEATLFGSWRIGRRADGVLRRHSHPIGTVCKYLRSVPGKAQLLEWAEQQRAFDGPVLIVWARDEKLMPPEHAVRLAEHFDNAELVWVDDSRTLIPIDQPEALTTHLEQFLARTTTP